MSESMLLGWTIGTWRRAIKWAGDDLDAAAMSCVFHEGQTFARFAAIRRKWEEAGGPMDGPCTNIEWVKSRGRGI